MMRSFNRDTTTVGTANNTKIPTKNHKSIRSMNPRSPSTTSQCVNVNPPSANTIHDFHNNRRGRELPAHTNSDMPRTTPTHPTVSLLKVRAKSKNLLKCVQDSIFPKETFRRRMNASHVLLLEETHENNTCVMVRGGEEGEENFTTRIHASEYWLLCKEFLVDCLPVLMGETSVDVDCCEEKVETSVISTNGSYSSSQDKTGIKESSSRHLDSRRRTIASESLWTILHCIYLETFVWQYQQEQKGHQYYHIRTQSIVLWRAFCSILRQRLILFNDRECNPIDFFHSLEEPSSLPIVGTPQEYTDETFHMLLEINQHYIRTFLQPKRSQEEKNDTSIWMIVSCSIDAIMNLIGESSIGRIIPSQAFVLPFVSTILLPMLEDMDMVISNDYDQQQHDEASNHSFLSMCYSKIQIMCIDCISILLHYKQHSTSLLAPISVDRPHIHMDTDESRDHSSCHMTHSPTKTIECVNPLRQRLLTYLTHVLISESHSTFPRQNNRLLHCTVSRCLTLLLEKIKWVDSHQQNQRQHSHKITSFNNKFSSNITGVIRWIYNSIQTTSLAPKLREFSLESDDKQKNLSDTVVKTMRYYALSLLLSMLRCPTMYEQILSQNWHLFFPPLFDRKSTSVSLTSLLSVPSDDLYLSSTDRPIPVLYDTFLSLSSCCEYLTVIPLRLWMIAPTTDNFISIDNKNRGFLSSRVRNSLATLIQATYKCSSHVCSTHDSFINNQDKSLMHSLMVEASRLSRVLVTVIPFEEEDIAEPKSLVTSSIRLLRIMGEYITSMLGGRIKMVSKVIVRHFIEDLAFCMGGIEAVDGTISPVPIPTKRWLTDSMNKDDSRETFADSILNFIYSCLISFDSVKSQSEALPIPTHFQYRDLLPDALNLLTCIVQTNVSLVLKSKDIDQVNFSGSKLMSVITALVLSRDVSLKLFGSKIIHAVVSSGDSRIIESTSLRQFLVTKLQYLIEENEPSVRIRALNSFGSIPMSYWENIIKENGAILFTSILSFCLEYSGPVHATIRSEACKAVGNIISTILLIDQQEVLMEEPLLRILHSMSDDAVKVSASALKDSDPDVRCMALFTIGNMAFALTKGTVGSDMSRRLGSKLVHISDSVCQRLEDTSDKVIGNAIRTVGHLFHAFALSAQGTISSEDNIYLETLCVDVLSTFANKVSVALNDAISDTSHVRSWKQRNFAKKHGWGSCNSLASLLIFSAKGTLESKYFCARALVPVISCIEYADVINDKIAYSAILTLLSASVDIWTSNSNDELALCLAACLHRLYLEKCVKTVMVKRFIEDVDLMLRKGLAFALSDPETTAIVHFLQKNTVTAVKLKFLYKWMLDGGEFDAQSFECIGTCLSCTGRAEYVSLVQMFCSRGAFIRRSECQFSSMEQDEL